jgi:hypothetical protein
MENESTVFRAKVPTETPTSSAEQRNPDEPTITTFEQKEQPPSIMSEPYIVKMFEIGEAKEHFSMPMLLKDINDFVLSECKRNNLEDNVESYKKIVEKYTKNLPDSLDKYALVEHISDLMKIDKKLIDAMLEKEELLKKPISELSSRQLKERIENGTK